MGVPFREPPPGITFQKAIRASIAVLLPAFVSAFAPVAAVFFMPAAVLLTPAAVLPVPAAVLLDLVVPMGAAGVRVAPVSPVLHREIRHGPGTDR